MNRLLIVPPPEVNEHIFSFILRVTNANFYDSIRWILDLSTIPASRDDIPGIVFGKYNLYKLAQITEIDIHHLISMTYAEHTDESLLSQAYIRPMHMKICPLCLKEKEYIEKYLDVQAYTTCVKHKTLLLSHCPSCKKRISWYRKNIFICSCGFDFRNHFPKILEQEQFNFSSFIYDAIYGNKQYLNHPVYSLHINQVCRFIYIFSNYYNDSSERITFSATNMLKLHNLFERTFKLLVNFPNSFFDFLEWRRSNKKNIYLKTGLLSEFGGLHKAIYKNFNEPDYKFIISFFEDYLSQRWNGGYLTSKCKRISITKQRSKSYLSKTTTANILQVNSEYIDKLINDGRLIGKVESMGKYRMFLIEKVSLYKLKEYFESLISSDDAATLLSTTRHNVADLIRSGLLTARRGPSIDSYAIWKLSIEDINNLLNEIRDKIFPKENAKELNIKKSIQKLSIIKVNLIKFISKILNGELSPSSEKKGVGLSRFYFSESDLAKIITDTLKEQKGKYMSPKEIAIFTGVPKSEVIIQWIRKGFFENYIKTPKFFLVPRESVVKFQQQYVILSKIAYELETSPRNLLNLLQIHDIFPISGPTIDGTRQYLLLRNSLQGRLYQSVIFELKIMSK